MTKHCPITSGRSNTYSQRVCEEEKCAFWDEELNQCVIKTMALAVAGKTSGGSNSTAQAYYIPPSSYCYTDARSNIHLETDLINNPVYNGGL
jgi:hypothetical protein